MKRYTCYSKSCCIAIKIFELELKETVAKSCSVKKVFLEVSQNSQENTCARVSFLIKLQASGLQLYQKRDSGTGVFLRILRNF